MLKREELTDPNSCLNRAKDDELCFVLLGRDESTPATIRFWCNRRVMSGKNCATDQQIVEARRVADELEQQWKERRRL